MEYMESYLVRNGTHASLWVDGEQVCEGYGCQAKVNKNKESINRCRAPFEGSKMTSAKITGTIRLHNATNRLIQLEAAALQQGRDLRHVIHTLEDDPDNPTPKRIALKGVSFDDLTLADWEAAKLGTIEAPFTAEGFEVLET